MTALPFALNHMAAPALPVDAFFSLAKSLGISMVEIRNDLAGNAIADGTPPEEVKALAEKHGLTIVSINALQRFNEWNEQRVDEARELISYARDCGAKALVLVPVNDGSGKADGVRQSNLRQALGALKPMLDAAGITGLVEPLGFEACSLRSKAEAAEAIRAVSGERSFRLVHDTFHHHLAGEDQFFRISPASCTSPASSTQTWPSRTCAIRIAFSSTPPTGWTIKARLAGCKIKAMLGPSHSSPLPPPCTNLPTRRTPCARAWTTSGYGADRHQQWKERESKPARPRALDGARIKWNTYSVISKLWFVCSVLIGGAAGVPLPVEDWTRFREEDRVPG